MFVSQLEVFKNSNQTKSNTKYFSDFQILKKNKTQSLNFLCLRQIANETMIRAELKMLLSDTRCNFCRAWEVGVWIAIGIEYESGQRKL